ncbi:MAG TPA: TolC family protein [Cytophagaceae bacterium]|nr:TolC family protein [Cytophagaceae bacterium]
MKLKFIVVVFFINSSLVNAQVLPFDSVTAKILSNNPELQMYNAQIKAMDTYAQGARAWEAPQIGAGFFMTPYKTSMWNADNRTGYNGMGNLMIQAQQMIPNPAKLKANEKYMKAMSSVENSNKDFTQNSLIAEAKTNYIEWIILKKKQTVLNTNEILMNYIIKTSEIRYPYEQEKLNTIYKAKASLAEINAMQLMIENDIQQKRIELNRLMNRDKDISFDIDTVFIVKNYELETIDTASIGAKRSDVRSIENNILLNNYKQKYEWSKSRPDFSIQYGHMFAFGNNPNLFTLMGMVSIPIAPWSSKMYKSTYAGLTFQKQAYQNQKDYIINETAGKLTALKSKIQNKKNQLKIYEKNIMPALEKNYKVTLLAYEQNTEDLFVVLDARQSLQMTQLEYYNQLQELLLLQVEYEKEIEKQ